MSVALRDHFGLYLRWIVLLAIITLRQSPIGGFNFIAGAIQNGRGRGHKKKSKRLFVSSGGTESTTTWTARAHRLNVSDGENRIVADLKQDCNITTASVLWMWPWRRRHDSVHHQAFCNWITDIVRRLLYCAARIQNNQSQIAYCMFGE